MHDNKAWKSFSEYIIEPYTHVLRVPNGRGVTRSTTAVLYMIYIRKFINNIIVHLCINTRRVPLITCLGINDTKASGTLARVHCYVHGYACKRYIVFDDDNDDCGENGDNDDHWIFPMLNPTYETFAMLIRHFDCDADGRAERAVHSKSCHLFKTVPVKHGRENTVP